jgi:hypothetical protein
MSRRHGNDAGQTECAVLCGRSPSWRLTPSDVRATRELANKYSLGTISSTRALAWFALGGRCMNFLAIFDGSLGRHPAHGSVIRMRRRQGVSRISDALSLRTRAGVISRAVHVQSSFHHQQQDCDPRVGPSHGQTVDKTGNLEPLPAIRLWQRIFRRPHITVRGRSGGRCRLDRRPEIRLAS